MNKRRLPGSLIALVIVASAAFASTGAALAADPSATAPPLGFATPEEAVTQYVAGVAANDFDQVLGACAIDQMATGYRFDLAAERFGAFTFTTMLAPATDPFYVQINRDVQQGTIARTVMLLSYSLLSSETIDGSVVAPADAARAQQFMSDVDPAKLAGLSVVDVRFPDAKLADDPRMLANFAANAAIWSADEQTERAALIALDGTDYVIGFTLLRYGSSWYVASQSAGLLATVPGFGPAVPTTPEEFESLTAG